MRGAEDRKDPDLRTVQAMMGHKSIKTAEQYLKPLRGTEDRPIGRFFPH
jgi:integrase